MKLIIGLGNPGERFKNNRHNVGHMFVDWVKEGNSFGKGVSLVETDVFMNESGGFVRRQVDFYKIKPEDLYVIHDDLDLPLGQYKIQLGVGPKVHYGVNSVEEALGDKNFWRVRIGVDNRQQAVGNRRTPGEEYVLQDFTPDEKKKLEEVFDAIQRELKIRN